MSIYRRNKGLAKLGAMALVGLIVIAFAFYAVQALAAIGYTTDAAVNASIIHKGEAVNVSAKWNETASFTWLSHQDAGASWANDTAIAGLASNWSFHVISTNSGSNLGVYNVKIFANNSTGSQNVTSQKQFTVFGYSNLTNTTPLSSPGILRGVGSIPYTCKVTDSNSTGDIDSYPITFMKGGVPQTTVSTNPSGLATWTWSPGGGDLPGQHNISCSISDYSYYNVDFSYVSGLSNVNDTLTLAELNRDNLYIYRSNSDTPNTLNISLTVRDSYSATVDGVAVRFWNGTSNLLDNCTQTSNGPSSGSCNCTTASGRCWIIWNPPDSYAPGSQTINVNGTKDYYTPFTTTSTSVDVRGRLGITIRSVTEGQKFYRNVSYWLNSTTVNEFGNNVSVNVSWYLGATKNITPLYGPENTTWNVSRNETLGWSYVKAVANKSYYDDTDQKVNAQVWGYSNITNMTAMDYSQNRSLIPIPIICRVRDNVTGDGIANYPVDFWKNGVKNTTILTNSVGNATWNYVPTDPVGLYNISCNITDNATLYYTADLNAAGKAGQINLTDRLVIFEYARDNAYIYRNDSYSPYITTLSAHIKDAIGDSVQNANVTWWDTTNGALIGNCTTDPIGFCSVQWNPSSNFEPNNITLDVNATGTNYYPSTTNSTWVVVQGVLILNMTNVVDEQKFYRNVNYFINSTTRAENGTAMTSHSVTWRLYNATWNNTLSPYGAENYSWTVGTGLKIGDYSLNATANLTYFTDSTQTKAIQIWGYSMINGTAIPASTPANTTTALACRVSDNVTNANISGYSVQFWSNDTLINSSTTDSTGWANTTYSWAAAGVYNVTCNITGSDIKYYTASASNSNSSLISVVATLSIFEYSVDNQFIYRNDSYSPYTASLSAHIKDTAGASVLNATVSWYDNSTGNLLYNCTDGTKPCNCTTNAIGFCSVTWNPPNNFEPSNVTLAVNATKSGYNPSTTNYTWVVVQGALNINITNVIAGQKFYRNVTYNVNSTTRAENGTVMTDHNVTWTLNNVTWNTTLSPYGAENYSWTVDQTFKLGDYSLNAIANRTYYFDSTQTKAIQIWGYSMINGTSIPVNGSINTLVNISCRVTDNVTNAPLNGYIVRFWSSISGMLGADNTDSTGWANITYSWPNAGVHNITCNFTDYNASYYTASVNNSALSELRIYGKLNVSSTSEAPGGVQVDQRRVAMLKLNFSAEGETINVTQINVTLTGTATDTNVSAIELWNDSAGIPNKSLSLTVPATFNGGVANLTLTQPIVVPAGGWKVVHVLYNISGTAFNSFTLGVTLNNSNISAIGNTSVLPIQANGSEPYSSALSTIWGWANITNATALSPTYQRGTFANVACLVSNVNTSAGITNYPVRFWRDNSTLLGTNLTNSSGIAVWNWNTTNEAVGPYNITCNITDNETLYFNDTVNNNWTGSTSLYGNLYIIFMSVSPNPIYRNDNFTPYVTTFRAEVKDELGAEIPNINISFWNATFSPALLANCTTDSILSPGVCQADWNPPNTTTPGNYSIMANASGPYYTSSTQNTTYLTIKGKLYLNITNIVSGQIFFKTQNISANVTGFDENGNVVPPPPLKWFINSTNLTNVTPPMANLTTNWENVTWYINESWTPLGVWVLNVSTNLSYYDDYRLLWPIQIWGWSRVNETNLPAATQINTPVNLACRVVDANTTSPLSSHYVNFWSNVTGFLGNNYTLFDGWSNITWTPTTAGVHLITCNITTNPAQYYTPSSGVSVTTRVYGILTANWTDEAPYTAARGTSVGMLRLNLTAFGENITLNNVSVLFTGTADDTNLTAVELWNDSSGPSMPIPGASDTSSPYELAPTSYIITNGTSKIIHVVYNISSSGMPYKTVQATIEYDNSTIVSGATSGYTFYSTMSWPADSSETFIRQLPSPDLVSPADGTITTNSTVYFNWTNVSGAVNYTIKIDNSPNMLSPEYNNTWTDRNYTWTSQQGIWYWRVSSIDAGGGASDSTIWKLTVDSSKPYINLTAPANGSTWTNPTQLIYTPWDNFSSTLNCYYTLDAVPSTLASVINGTTQYVTLSLTTGQHNISINCTDLAGNSNVSVLNNFTVDTTGALISSVVLDRNPPYYVGNVFPANNMTVNVTASDPSGVSVVTANGVVLTNITPTVWTGNVSVAFTEGIHELQVVANDTAGNRNSTTVYYFVDNTLPNVTNVTITYPLGQNHVKRYQNITISAKVFDPISGGVSSGINATIAVITNATPLGVLPGVGNSINLALTDPVNNIWSATWNCSFAGCAANLSDFQANVQASDNANIGYTTSSIKNFTVDNTGFAIFINSITPDKTSASASGTDYWQWTFNVSASGGTRIRMKVANWTDGSGHIIPVASYARLQYQNATGTWKTYNILNSYNETEAVDALNITSGWTTLILNQTIPAGTYPASYSTTYAFGIYA